MTYIDTNLLENEHVLYRGEVHPIIFAWPVILLATGLLMLPNGEGGLAFGRIFLLVGAIWLVRAILAYVSTELAITNQRVIAKFGFARRRTMELNHNKVESLNVNQGTIGRMLDFGSLVIRGTGSGSTVIPKIKEPLSFRRAQNEAVGATVAAEATRPSSEQVS